jgi:hypothetical protein
MALASTNISGIGLLCLSIALVIVVLSRYYLASRRPRNFPPGPPTVPFVGNLTQVPPVKAFLKYVAIVSLEIVAPIITFARFEQMKAQYGSILGLKLGSQNIVVLNSYKHVKA